MRTNNTCEAKDLRKTSIKKPLLFNWFGLNIYYLNQLTITKEIREVTQAFQFRTMLMCTKYINETL